MYFGTTARAVMAAMFASNYGTYSNIVSSKTRGVVCKFNMSLALYSRVEVLQGYSVKLGGGVRALLDCSEPAFGH